jgi:hypothetical protein
MSKQLLSSKTPTMIIPLGTEIQPDAHGQLNIRTPGNLVIETSGHYGILESTNGSIRIEPEAEVEAVQVRCAEACYVQGSLTAWKVSASSLQLESQARASIVLQDTQELSIGKGAQLVGNFSSEKELFVLFSRFADQLKALPLFTKRGGEAPELTEGEEMQTLTLPTSPESEELTVEPEESVKLDSELPDPLFFALILLEREFARSAYGPTSQRVIEEIIKLLQEKDLEALGLTYRTLCGRIVEPGGDVQRAYDLMDSYFSAAAK